MFVAEKKAALKVVKDRLDDVGIGHLAIDLDGADLSATKVMQQVAHTLEVLRSAVMSRTSGNRDPQAMCRC